MRMEKLVFPLRLSGKLESRGRTREEYGTINFGYYTTSFLPNTDCQKCWLVNKWTHPEALEVHNRQHRFEFWQLRCAVLSVLFCFFFLAPANQGLNRLTRERLLPFCDSRVNRLSPCLSAKYEKRGFHFKICDFFFFFLKGKIFHTHSLIKYRE